MENLFIETEKGKIPIDDKEVKKLKLEKGSVSPYTRSRIVGANGEFPPETSMIKDSKNKTRLQNDASEETENVIMSTSEIIDFSQGVDSDTGQ